MNGLKKFLPLIILPLFETGCLMQKITGEGSYRVFDNDPVYYPFRDAPKNSFFRDLPDKFVNYGKKAWRTNERISSEGKYIEYTIDSIGYGDVLEFYPFTDYKNGKFSENPSIYFFNINDDGLFNNQTERLDDPLRDGLNGNEIIPQTDKTKKRKRK